MAKKEKVPAFVARLASAGLNVGLQSGYKQISDPNALKLAKDLYLQLRTALIDALGLTPSQAMKADASFDYDMATWLLSGLEYAPAALTKAVSTLQATRVAEDDVVPFKPDGQLDRWIVQKKEGV